MTSVSSKSEILLATELKDRVSGCLVGLAAGDKNGGPIQMALRLCETLCEAATRKEPFDARSSFFKYYQWFQNRGDGSNDTGPVAVEIFLKVSNLLEGKTIKKVDEKYFKEVLTLETILSISRDVDIKLEGQTAGVNGAHRGCVLGMAKEVLPTKEMLFGSAKIETSLTHYHEIAQQCTQISALLCRILIQNGYSCTPWWQLLSHEMKGEKWHIEIHSKLDDILQSNDLEFEQMASSFESSPLSIKMLKNGFSPNVLRAALFFLRKYTAVQFITSHFNISTNSVDDIKKNRQLIVGQCLNESLNFSGKSNYCPVLVGAFLGAMFGQTSITPDLLEHCVCINDVKKIASKIAEEQWN